MVNPNATMVEVKFPTHRKLKIYVAEHGFKSFDAAVVGLLEKAHKK